jgi:hypothetical protein
MCLCRDFSCSVVVVTRLVVATSSSSALAWANSALMRKVLSNVSLVIKNLIVKYVDDEVDARASMFVRSIRLHSAGTPHWSAMFVPPGHSSLLQKSLADRRSLVHCRVHGALAAPRRRAAADGRPPLL